MAKGTLKIHTENILPIIKKWLYSDKDIFVRELVSNACDALNKLKILQEREEAPVTAEELRIDLRIDKENRILSISDTGIGMTAHEVETYIAQVAFSGAEEFISKYKTNSEQDQIIGHFGLGFYSAYMVASKVEIQTLSFQADAAPVLWCCDGSSEYTLETGERTSRGTTISLFIDKESDEFLETARIREILERYCAFLPHPIYLNGERINEKDPLWMKSPSQCTEGEYVEFYRRLYPLEPDPIFWIHLNIDYPFHLKGILYFPRMNRRFDWSKNSIKLFCNRVFVSDHCKDLIPEYLMALRGAIDSSDIPLNVSRSTLQMDSTVQKLSSHIAKKVADRLAQVWQTDKENFIRSWPDLEMIVKLGILQDDKFYERAKEFVIWKGQSGEWNTLSAYLETQKDKIFYTSDESTPPAFLDLYKQKGIEVLYATSPVDTALMSFLESKLSVRFQRIDGGIDEAILDTAKEKTLLDASGKTESGKMADLIRSLLSLDKIEVEAKSLGSDTLPAFIAIDEQGRRMRDYFSMTGQTLPSQMGGKRTFVVNTNHRFIAALPRLQEKDPELAKSAIHHLYELSLLSQKELEPQHLQGFIQRSKELLEKLVVS